MTPEEAIAFVTQSKHHALLVLSSNRHNFFELLADSHSKQGGENVYTRALIHVDDFGVEEVEKLEHWHATQDASEKRALISFHTINTIAQNKLLKLFESPREGISFVVVTSSVHGLLPTLLSRMHILHSFDKEDEASTKKVQQFLMVSPEERMESDTFKDLLSSESVKEDVGQFFATLVEVLQQEKRYRDALRVATSLEHLRHPGSSAKMLLELIALTL